MGICWGLKFSNPFVLYSQFIPLRLSHVVSDSGRTLLDVSLFYFDLFSPSSFNLGLGKF